MANSCGGPNLDGTRCRRPRIHPPCPDHRPAALRERRRRRLVARFLRFPRTKGARITGWVRSGRIPGALFPTEPAVQRARNDWEHEMPEVLRDVYTGPLKGGWHAIDAATGSGDPCRVLDLAASLCEATDADDAERLLADLRDGGIAELSPRLSGQRAVRELARVRAERTGTLFADDTPSHAEQLAALATALRLLGVHACLRRGRADTCVCLAALTESGGLPSPGDVRDDGSVFWAPTGDLPLRTAGA